MAISRRDLLEQAVRQGGGVLVTIPIVGTLLAACGGGVLDIYSFPVLVRRDGTVDEILRHVRGFRLEYVPFEGRRESVLVEVEGKYIPIDRGPDVILIQHNGSIFRESLRTRKVLPGDQLVVVTTAYDAAENSRHRETNGRR